MVFWVQDSVKFQLFSLEEFHSKRTVWEAIQEALDKGWSSTGMSMEFVLGGQKASARFPQSGIGIFWPGGPNNWTFI